MSCCIGTQYRCACGIVVSHIAATDGTVLTLVRTISALYFEINILDWQQHLTMSSIICNS